MTDPPPTPPPVQYSPDGRYYWDGRQWVPVAPGPPTLEQIVLRKLDFEFEVGEAERHRVHFFFDQFWGSVRISVDGRRVIRDFRLFSFSATKRYRLTVGDREKHEVVIEKTRPWMAAGFRRQSCRVLVDGRPVGEYSS